MYGSKGDSHLRNIGVVMQMAGLRKGWNGTSKELGRCGGDWRRVGSRGRGGGGRGRKEKEEKGEKEEEEGGRRRIRRRRKSRRGGERVMR